MKTMDGSRLLDPNGEGIQIGDNLYPCGRGITVAEMALWGGTHVSRKLIAETTTRDGDLLFMFEGFPVWWRACFEKRD